MEWAFSFLEIMETLPAKHLMRHGMVDTQVVWLWFLLTR